jgi:hypothetical protein
MRNSYPLHLFSLARAVYLREHHSNNDLFMYILFMGLWVDVEIMALIIETLLLFALIHESLMELNGLRQKPNACDHHVTFASRAKLRRFVCTLAAQLLSLRSGNSNLGRDRIGSYIKEDYIGNIRSICHGANRPVTVSRQISRFELARKLLSELSIECHIAKHVNLGGVSVTTKSDW